ncbi:uncharacterized protein LOC132628626 [Lycium barbarum]|uniref:uncharacterized protein LOC132628626 n=1 Tax=Lycium barbarum TaxID=112863 RepID=UPI00293ED9E7|nr:uncharacterized protein LOC132628626 [Lycium barbarum]
MLVHYRDTTPQKKKLPFEITGDGVLRYPGRLCVSGVAVYAYRLREKLIILAIIFIQGQRNMYHDIKKIYWWDGMKKDIAEFIAQCPNCQQIDVQAERMIQKLEDMLWACVIDFRDSWYDHFPLIEFAYSNSYHSNIQIVPYEALYGR